MTLFLKDYDKPENEIWTQSTFEKIYFNRAFLKQNWIECKYRLFMSEFILTHICSICFVQFQQVEVNLKNDTRFCRKSAAIQITC